MGLEAMSVPDALDSHSTDALRLGHGPRAPMRGGLGSRVERGLDDRPNLAFRNAWDTTGTRSVLFQSGPVGGPGIVLARVGPLVWRPPGPSRYANWARPLLPYG
jgi:hypothetical protein